MKAWSRGALVLFGIGWGANQFSSLLGSYRDQLHLSDAAVQGFFAVYAVGLVPGLLLGGPAADSLGRRRLVLPAAFCSALASVFLLLGTESVYWLLIGRFLAGAATGVVLAAGTAWVKELSHPPYDLTAHPTSGARRAGLAISAGFGAGPLAAAIIAQWAPHPLELAYLPHLLIMAVAIPLAWRVDEPPRPAERFGSRFGAIRVPAFLWVVAPAAPWVFVAPTVAFAVLPGELGASLGRFATVYAGIAAGVTLGAGLLVQPLARRMSARHVRSVVFAGLAAVVVGLGIAALTVRTANPVLALVAAVVLGGGYGLCLVFGLTEVSRIAGAGQLAGLTAVFYALTYVGFTTPYLLALLHGLASLPVLLLALAGLAALTLVGVASTDRLPVQNAERPHSPV
ncbi:MAG TPA: MFS transporter [Pseudonocardiaceae bacterium]|jgi:MFS family permease|nr:MFS transporter [Pseudonocardiaceae bacterium]